MKDGLVSDILVESRKGKEVRLENPWKGSGLKWGVHRDGPSGKVECEGDGGLAEISFQTVEGNRYFIAPMR